MITHRYPYGASFIFVGIAAISLCLLISLPTKNIHKEGMLYVVCTTGILADTVATIGGDCVHVDYLMGPGVDPHIYRARESDMHTLAQAHAIFHHGLHLEGKLGSLFSRMRLGIPSIAVSDAIPKPLLRLTCPDKSIYDPHVWHDVSLWRHIATHIGNTLITLDPHNTQLYTSRMQQYISDLDALDVYIHQQVALIPPTQRILITAHDAFSYFGKAYGFEVVGLQGINTDSEISTHDIQRVVDIIIRYNVRALFVESLIPERTLNAVKDAVHAQGKTVSLGSELFSDALGDVQSGANTYILMMKHNINALVRALKESS